MSDRQSVLDKIKALLGKTVANGCTEAEAMAALDRARAMMDAYEVTDAELQMTKEEKARIRGTPGDTTSVHIRNHLYLDVAEFCGCKAWRNMDGMISFCGLPSDVEFALWLLDALESFLRAEMANHLMGFLGNRTERRIAMKAFAAGCTERISERISALVAQSKKAAAGNSRALVVVKNELIERAMADQGIKLKSVFKRRDYDAASFRAGRAAGNRATFGRPVEGEAAVLRIGARRD